MFYFTLAVLYSYLKAAAVLTHDSKLAPRPAPFYTIGRARTEFFVVGKNMGFSEWNKGVNGSESAPGTDSCGQVRRAGQNENSAGVAAPALFQNAALQCDGAASLCGLPFAG